MLRVLQGCVLAGAVAACGGSGAVPPTSGPGGNGAQPPVAGSPGGGPIAAIDSCTLLSDEEIEAATGQRVTERSPSTLTQVFSSVCDIELDAGGSLTVSVLPTGGRSMYECCFEPFIGEGGTPPLDEAVEGLGDKAGISGDDDIMVLKDDILFDIFYIEFGRNDKLAVVRYLAEVALAKLPCIAAGCPGLTPPPPPSRGPVADVCALLTDEEIVGTTGFATLTREPSTVVGVDPSCTWTLDSEPFPGLDYIELTIMTAGGRARFDLEAEGHDPPLEHLPGLGDDTIKTGTIPGGAVYSVIGDRLLTLEFKLPLSVDDPYTLVVPLVEIALTRL